MPTAQAAAEITRRLDGIPLAIELAAARSRVAGFPDGRRGHAGAQAKRARRDFEALAARRMQAADMFERGKRMSS